MVLDKVVVRSSVDPDGRDVLPQILEVVQEHGARRLVHQALWDPALQHADS